MEAVQTPLIEMRGIVKSFPGVRALKEVSFTVRPGEVHSICGENGAGKSTLIKIMTGARQKDAGALLVDGSEVDFKSTHDGIAQGISCVYQELSIAPQLDVAQNIYIGNLPMKGKTIDHKKLYEGTSEVLRELDMNISPKAIAGELSIGQQQMLEIGRALTRKARCIIMDEPTSSLSEHETDTLFGIIEKLKSRGIAIVYISHKLDEVMSLSDRITVIRDGENIVTIDLKTHERQFGRADAERAAKDYGYSGEATQNELIAHMIGRSLENLYQKTPAEQGEVVLEVKGLTHPGVFEDVSFSVRKGEVLGFFGLVGAGRSEIMRAVFGVDKYQSGEVFVGGEKLRSGSPTKAIDAGLGFCTEDRKKEGLMLRLSILLNMTLVELPRISSSGFINRKKQRDLTDGYVRDISIKTPSVSELAGNLSGGNQQKVVVAKWLMTNPKALIVDEPTRGIDVGSKSEIYGLISDLANRGVAIIVVSSEIEEILGICDRVITVCEGRVMADLPVEGLASETILATALGKTDDAVMGGER